MTHFLKKKEKKKEKKKIKRTTTRNKSISELNLASNPIGLSRCGHNINQKRHQKLSEDSKKLETYARVK